jgi:sn-glycerol 3-phosphate transport system ATP-binding protein
MRLEIKQLQQSVGTTSLYVTHDQVEAMTLADRLVGMNQGLAEQIGTPISVYEKPASVFVAGFIGSPAMNLIEAEIADNGLTLAGGATVRLRDTVLPETGRKVLLGVRPEHMKLVSGDGAADFKMKVVAVEILGADTLAHGHPAEGNGKGDMLVARLPGSTLVQAGDVLPLAIDPGMAHLFDAGTSRRIETA